MTTEALRIGAPPKKYSQMICLLLMESHITLR